MAGADARGVGPWRNAPPLVSSALQLLPRRCLVIPAMLRDRRFIELLQMFDREIAERARAHGCPECGGVLHDARYPRKPRGLPSELKSIDFFRESLCCAQDCCRRRTTPPSVLFFGRRHYLSVSHLLLSVLDRKPNARRRLRLKQELGVDRTTLARWRRWWAESFKRTKVFRTVSTLSLLAPDVTWTPRDLLQHFPGRGLTRLLTALTFLAPIGTPRLDPELARGWAVNTRRLCPRGDS